jgi:hypothetical protein
MLSRAIGLATAMLAIVGFADSVRAQNLEAGKSASQIFSGNCTACHKGARGLLRTVAPGSLPGFLRQHYTTGPDMAKMLSAYLISNGAADERYRAETPRQHPGDLKPASGSRRVERQGRPSPSREVAPDISAQDEPRGRKGRHPARPGTENPEAARPAPEEAAGVQETSKPATRKKLSKRGKQAPEESPKAGQAKDDVVAKPETAKSSPSDAEPTKGETGAADSSKAETPKAATAKEQPADEKAGGEQVGKPEKQVDKSNGKQDAPSPDLTKPESNKIGAGKPEAGAAETNKSDVLGSEVAKPEKAKSGTAPENSGSDTKPVTATSEPKAAPLRADPVPAVTPAPKVGEGDAKPASETTHPTPVPTQSASPPAESSSPAGSADSSGSSPSGGSPASTSE